MQQKTHKCVICGNRPANGNGHGRCSTCQAKIEKEERARTPEKPFRYLTYRGGVVGLFRKPGLDGTLHARQLNINPERLPKSITLDLNTYLNGYSRETVKRFKRCVRELAHV